MNLRRILDGLVVIAFGVVLLGNTTGVLPWSVWWSILMLWPLLLVAAGIDVIGRSLDNSWLRLLSALIVLGGIAYGVFVGVATPGGPDSVWLPGIVKNAQTEPFSFNEPMNTAVDHGSVRIEGAVGRLIVHSTDGLLTSEGRTPFGPPVFDVSTSGSELDAHVTPGDNDNHTWPFGSDARLEVGLGKDIPWDVRLDTGVSKLEADLADVQVASLKIDMGVSNGTVTLGTPAEAGSDATIDTGVSNFTLRLPRDAQVEIVSDDGLASVNVPGSLRRVDDEPKTWRTSGFGNGGSAWRVRIKAGVATVAVEQY